ncbi:sorbitol utilization protein SOU2 [Paecilomyces variotii No. 5]|uniref:Sorbitol utilization protein SOU2 n=1 Tax=Byssochlamys spectabilis (strain No. 5 / NBRC 109023) TaxID=1356009 RepID=V5FQ85_BYSSN|nr:sorbitol utilization protein SOU2 [Paecilomyces variotii No. 5]
MSGSLKPHKLNSVMPLFSLQGRTAIVSGVAKAGLGFSIVHVLAEAGANVAILYNRNKEAIEGAEIIRRTYGVQCSAYQLDITKQEQLETTIHQIVNDFNGRLDIFVANSGIVWDEGAVIDSSISHYHEVMSTNLDGVYYSARAAGQQWKRQSAEETTITGKKLTNYSGGSFIATASMSGHIVNVPHIQAAYNTSKAGVIHLCRSLAVEWAGFARANSISPGYVDSGLTGDASDEVKELLKEKTPMRRIGSPDELKGAYLYLASDASSFTTGTDIIVDGGYCLL